jgi:hypothetical protein
MEEKVLDTIQHQVVALKFLKYTSRVVFLGYNTDPYFITNGPRRHRTLHTDSLASTGRPKGFLLISHKYADAGLSEHPISTPVSSRRLCPFVLKNYPQIHIL